MKLQYILAYWYFALLKSFGGIGTCVSTNIFIGCPRWYLVFSGQKERPEITVSSVISGLYGLFWIISWYRERDLNSQGREPGGF